MHPNEQVLRDADDAQERGDVEAFLSHYTDDVVVHIAGKSSFAGTYAGKDEFMNVFGRFMEATPGFTFDSHAYLANEEHGVSMQRSHYERGDETLDANDVFINHFRDGKICEFWYMSADQDAVDMFLG